MRGGEGRGGEGRGGEGRGGEGRVEEDDQWSGGERRRVIEAHSQFDQGNQCDCVGQ